LTCAYHSSAAIDSRGRLFLWGRNEKSYLGVASLDDAVLEPKCITNFGSTILVKQVASGWQHTLALTGDGQLFAWGANDEGQLGLAHFEERSKPE
jgi:RCC1 and BTB domain-containing protein